MVRLKIKNCIVIIATLLAVSACIALPSSVSAAPAPTTPPSFDPTSKPDDNGSNYTDPSAKYQCGGDDANPVHTSINIGCKGSPADLNPIVDMTFALIRFLSIGVGLVIVGSFVVAGIQYTASRGDPKATEDAINRIKSTVGALLIFIFAYAILNYIVPAGLFNIK